MRRRFLFTVLVLVLFLTSVLEVSAYGWGYKRNEDHRLPDVGFYEDILRDYDAYYADLSGEKLVYLTFDNGYEQGFTPGILDVLKEEDVPATFFVTGHYVSSEPELVKRMVAEGHIVGNHSHSHPDFTRLSRDRIKEELDRVEAAVAELTGQKEMIFLRPPRGTFNEETLKWTSELGYTQVFWSLAFNDWQVDQQRGWKYAYDQIMGQIHPGAIILLHTVSQDNAEALQRVIRDLRKQEYNFKSLLDLHLKHKILPGFPL